jgi:hypothetical protein
MIYRRKRKSETSLLVSFKLMTRDRKNLNKKAEP